MNVNCSFNEKITWRYRNGIVLQIQDFNIAKRMFVLYLLNYKRTNVLRTRVLLFYDVWRINEKKKMCEISCGV